MVHQLRLFRYVCVFCNFLVIYFLKMASILFLCVDVSDSCRDLMNEGIFDIMMEAFENQDKKLVLTGYLWLFTLCNISLRYFFGFPVQSYSFIWFFILTGSHSYGCRTDILILFLNQDSNLLRSYVVRQEGIPLLGLLVCTHELVMYLQCRDGCRSVSVVCLW